VEEHDPAEAPLGTAEINRKGFIQRSAVVTGGLIVLSRMPGAGTAQASTAEAAEYVPTALSAADMASLTAILTRLLPADDLGPGAVEANVHVYIDRELTGYYKALLPTYQQGLAIIELAARQQGAASFAALTPAKQDALLARVQAGKLAGLKPDKKVPKAAYIGKVFVGAGPGATQLQQGFFQLLLEHMREGMFSDPMYGGNKNYAGWNLISYPGVKLVYTAQEQAIGTKVALTHTSVATYGGHPYE
jgi:gluconate 2-dehydrogenase gamma chain